MTRNARPPALALRGIEKSFPVGFWRGRRPVLRGIDVEVPPGEGLGLVGPNGSGKTTLLRLSAGVERPSAGHVGLFGSTPDDPAARARLVVPLRPPPADLEPDSLVAAFDIVLSGG